METAAVRRTPAPYGKACSNCVKTKCRCVLREGGVCERYVVVNKFHDFTLHVLAVAMYAGYLQAELRTTDAITSESSAYHHRLPGSEELMGRQLQKEQN